MGIAGRLGLLAVALAIVPAVSGCDWIRTDENYLFLRDGQWKYRQGVVFESGGPVVEGARACMYVAGFKDEDGKTHEIPDEVLRDCYEIEVQGAAEAEDDCVRFVGVGEASQVFTLAAECPVPGLDPESLEADQLRFEVVPNDGLSAALDPYVLVATEQGSVADGDPPPATPKQTVRVVEDVASCWPVVLLDGARAVAWSSDIATLDGPRDAECPYVEDGGFEWVGTRLSAGEQADVALTLDGHTYEAGTVRGVPLEEAKSLDLVAYYAPDPGEPDGFGKVEAVLAVVRDGDGNVLHGAPIDWAIDADFDVELGRVDFAPESDLAYVNPTSCANVFEPTSRTATVSATLGDLATSIDLAWRQPADQDPPPPECADEEGDTSGCGCSARSRSSAGGLICGVLLLAARRRRR